jgi:hypothetical protein
MNLKDLTAEQETWFNHYVYLLNRVNEADHDPEEAKELQAIFDKLPDAALPLGNLVAMNRSALIKKTISGKATQMAVTTKATQMQKELGYEQSPHLEKLVIDNLTDSWLYMHHVQHNLNSWLREPGAGYDAAEYWEKRMNSAQRRFLRACSTLARIRKMKLPALQVNIAQQQVNQVKT